MTDDLKERLRHADEYEPLGHDGWEALDCITDLEARLAAAEAEVQRIKEINVAHCRAVNTLLVCESRMETRAKAAEAGEDALAEALRSYRADLCEGFCLEAEWSDEAHDHPAMQRDCGGCLAAAALTAYEARRR